MDHTLTPLAVFSADNHLRPVTWAKHPDLRFDAYHSFQQVIDFCVAKRLPLLLAGDTFDEEHPPAGAVVFFARQADRMKEAGQSIFYVRGDHDRSQTPWPSVHSACVHLDKKQATFGPWTIYGLDYRPSLPLKEALAEVPIDKINTLLMHQGWREIQPIGHVDAAFTDLPCPREGLPMPILLTGDYHISGSWNGRSADGRGITAWSPGSTSMQRLSESPDKQFYVLCRGPGNDRVVESVRLHTRVFRFAECKTEEEFQQLLATIRGDLPLCDHLPTELQRPAFRIKFNTAIESARDRIVEAGGEKYHLFLEPIPVVDEVIVEHRPTAEHAFSGLISAVQQLCSAEPDTYYGLVRLLDAENPKSALAELHTEFIAAYGSSQTSEHPG